MAFKNGYFPNLQKSLKKKCYPKSVEKVMEMCYIHPQFEVMMFLKESWGQVGLIHYARVVVGLIHYARVV